ncbi:hypothetical protein [Flavobacterium hydatis]|uniref:Uncharacterized protein n=1 Tax=Flavobacterium hydatis TaxID=991 RepID=A0A086A1U8_FLAHY|nr:hypothetical protein [Flavobacterium hydatis]KFF10662.1 hypothetical protein IW20_20560 [Flavobacterium hydatis]OXA94284.1 hypothetical protein B0A62_11565 [Flavobacterium hydatis]
MKKIIVLFVYLSLLLLGGGQYLNAGTHQNSSSHTLEKKHRVKFTNQDSGSSLIEDADFDIDEEHLGGDIKDGISDRLFAGNYSLLDNWYLTLSCQSILDHHQNSFKIFTPFCGQSNPIYITQRVLRI